MTTLPNLQPNDGGAAYTVAMEKRNWNVVKTTGGYGVLKVTGKITKTTIVRNDAPKAKANLAPSR
jgi:hypothetical protein